MKRLLFLFMIGTYFASQSCVPKNDESLSESVLNRVASKYYTQIEKAGEQERTNQIMKVYENNLPTPSPVKGRVINIRGVPIAKADVVIEVWVDEKAECQEVVRGVTDKNGYFEIPLKHTSNRFSIDVTKQGFSGWSCYPVYDGIKARINRKIDQSYLALVASEKDPEERLWMLLEIIGSHDGWYVLNEDEIVFPFLGLLRPDLLSVIHSHAFDLKDDKQAAPSDRAKWLLELWQDSEDKTLFSSDSNLPVDISGKTIQEVCEKWKDYHYAQEKVEKKPPPFSLSEPIMDPDKKHTLVTFLVYYAYWGYSMRLSLINDGNEWHLVMVQDYKHWHNTIGYLTPNKRVV